MGKVTETSLVRGPRSGLNRSTMLGPPAKLVARAGLPGPGVAGRAGGQDVLGRDGRVVKRTRPTVSYALSFAPRAS